MNRFQLELIDYASLERLRDDVKAELEYRRKEHGVSARRRFISALHPKPLESNAEIEHFNSSGLRSVPSYDGDIAHRLCLKARYLPSLLAQDWSEIYQSDTEQGASYVYAHVDPAGHCFVAPNGCGGNYGGLPFYIGKGKGARAWDLKRNQAHGKKIDAALKAGFVASDIVKVIAESLSDSRALELESKLVYFFGTAYEDPPGPLVNLDIPRRPIFEGSMMRYMPKRHNGKAKA